MGYDWIVNRCGSNSIYHRLILTDRKSIAGKLTPYLPEGAIPIVSDLFAPHNVELRISRPRRTKLGDYRAPHTTPYHRISINNDLNQYSFLITLLHELAHLTAWEKHKHHIKPHGAEWKAEFQLAMLPIFKADILPDDVRNAVEGYMSNPKASSCTDLNLMKTLREYDDKSNLLFLEDLPENAVFALNRGRIFRKGPQLRKRFKCLDLNNRRHYLISPLAEVELIPNQNQNIPAEKTAPAKPKRKSRQFRLFG